MTVVKLVKQMLCQFQISVINRTRCCHSSSLVFKDTQTNTLEEKRAKKLVQVKWQITDMMMPFYGPIIQQNGDKTTTPSMVASCQTFDYKTVKLLPVGLWSNREVERGRAKLHFAVRRKSTKADGPTKKSSKKLPDESSKASVPQPTLEPAAEPFPADSTHLTGELPPPGQPFFERNSIVLPFPMVLDKKSPEEGTESKEISTLPGPETELPSVTTILSKTRSKESELALTLWKKRKIAEVGEEGYKEFMRGTKIDIYRCGNGHGSDWITFYIVLHVSR